MNYAVIIIMFGGLHQDTLLVMDNDRTKCGERTEALFEKECKAKGMECTDGEMSDYKDDGVASFKDYDIYLTWPSVMNEGSDCKRCGSDINNGFCSNVTCPFSDHKQECPAGWNGHPEKNGGECTCKGDNNE